MQGFSFLPLEQFQLSENELSLKLERTSDRNSNEGYVPCYHFQILSHGKVAGKIRLRIGTEAELKTAGHIGYEVDPAYQGNRLAGRSCKLILPIAKAHNLKAVWFIIAVANKPSQKTATKLGAIKVETITIGGRKYRRRYKLDI